MRSNLTADVRAALQAGQIRLAIFASFKLKYTTARFWTGPGNYELFGCNWSGMGRMASVSEIEETIDLRATGTTFALSGIPTQSESGRNLVDYVQFHSGSGGRVDAWLALFNTQTWTVIPEPRKIFSGTLETPQIRLSPKDNTFTIAIAAEGVMARMNKKSDLRMNHETQQSLYPGDKFFEFINRTVRKPDDFG